MSPFFVLNIYSFVGWPLSVPGAGCNVPVATGYECRGSGISQLFGPWYFPLVGLVAILAMVPRPDRRLEKTDMVLSLNKISSLSRLFLLFVVLVLL